MDGDGPLVRSGQVVALRLFDLAYGIDLKRAEQLWASRAQGASARSRLAATPPKAVAFGVPPLELELGPVEIALGEGVATAGAAVRLYDFGIAALALRLPVEDLGWGAFADLVNGLDQAVGAAAATPVWTRLLDQLRGLLGEALERPSLAPLEEDYLLAMVHRLEPALTAEELMQRADLVPLLSGADRPLAEGARRDLLRHRFSYYTDDLVVLTWDRAFLLEPQRETDIADVLEMANAQLLELRSYDELLDAELPRMHALVEAARRRTSLLAARRYAGLARDLHALVGEVTALAERVDNALQVTEDIHLARVYAAAMEQLRVPVVGAAVDRKLAIIRATYTALHDEAAGSRAELLETAILALIAFEVVLSLWRH